MIRIQVKFVFGEGMFSVIGLSFPDGMLALAQASKDGKSWVSPPQIDCKTLMPVGVIKESGLYQVDATGATSVRLRTIGVPSGLDAPVSEQADKPLVVDG